MKRFWLLMILAAFAFPLAACSGGEEADGDGNGGVEGTEEGGGTEEGAGGEEGAGAEEASMNSGAGEAVAAVCCGGACDAPAGYCCSDGTCNGNHAELPVHTG